MSACERWGAMVRQEHAQSDRMRPPPGPQDYWVPYAKQFVADPKRTDDVVLEALKQQIEPHHSVMDVGAGAGRFALPLATLYRHLIALEPSASMADALQEQADSQDVHNISLVQSTWQDAEVPRVDIIICCHVVYTVPDIELFIRKLTAQADRVIVILYDNPPQSQLRTVWKRIHEEDRLQLPSLPELCDVLEELNINAGVERLPTDRFRGYPNLDEAAKQLAGRLYIQPGDEKAATLEQLLPGLLEEVQGEFRVRGSQPLTPCMVSWSSAD